MCLEESYLINLDQYPKSILFIAALGFLGHIIFSILKVFCFPYCIQQWLYFNLCLYTGSEPSNPLSLLAIVVFVVVLVVIIIVAILVLIMIKKCLHKKTKKTQQPSVIQLSTVNNIIAADINIEGNPADVKTKSNPTDVKTENDQTNVKKNNTEKSKTENDPADIKMQSNPAYQTMKKEYYEVKDNYYY